MEPRNDQPAKESAATDTGRPPDLPPAARKNEGPRSLRRRGLAVLFLLAAACAVVGFCWFDPTKTAVPLCSFYAWTGLHCPGCGVLRATHELLHGHLLVALHYNVLWTVLWPLAVYLAISEWRVSVGRRPWPGNLAQKTWFWITLGGVGILFFILRNLPWEPFLWLAPPG
jgi:hypothetical protein